MPDKYVNLTETGALTQTGHRYNTDAQDGHAQSDAFRNRMADSHAGLRGRAGLQFSGMTGTHAENLKRLGAQFAEQAVRAVRGEQAIRPGEEEAVSTQQVSASNVETQVSTLSRPINA
jgi:hypothetical protein